MEEITRIVVGVTAGIWVIYDLYVFIRFGSEDTISKVIWRESSKRPIIAFVIGFVFGHIFWPNC